MATTLVSVTTNPLRGITGSGDIRSNQATEKREYIVVFSDDLATGYDARNATGVPLYGVPLVSPIAGTIPLYVSNKTATQNIQDGRIWTVDVEYSTYDAQRQPPAPSGFTTGDKYGVQVSMSSVPVEQTIMQDNSATPKILCNTNNEPIDPPITLPLYDKQLEIMYWSDKIDQTSIDAAIGKTNSAIATITIGTSTWSAAINTLKFNSYSWDVHYDVSGVQKYQIKYQFMYRETTWTLKIPNMSYYQLVGSNLVPITDGRNPPQAVSSPRYIDGSGAVIVSGSPIYLLSFNVYKTVSFSSLLAQIP